VIARLSVCVQRSSEPLSDDEFLFIRDALEARAGKETNARLRQLEKQLIAAQYARMKRNSSSLSGSLLRTSQTIRRA
jgi:hypothetical protein